MHPALALWTFRAVAEAASSGQDERARARAADGAADKYPRVGAPSEVERRTGLPLSDAGKREYFALLGDGRHPMQGFDTALEGGLRVLPEPAPSGDVAGWSLTVDDRHLNPAGTLHGGCTAAVVDVLGTALIALGNEEECGVAINLQVEFVAAAARGDTVRFDATMLKRGRRLAFVQVLALGDKGKVLARGTVTKSLRGAPKTAAKG